MNHLAVLRHLDSRDDAQATAAEIGKVCRLSHEATYTALVQLESLGAVRVNCDFEGQQRKSSGVRAWELMPKGAAMLRELSKVAA
jgi:DNA-binding IclR family transcriptional regulator